MLDLLLPLSALDHANKFQLEVVSWYSSTADLGNYVDKAMSLIHCVRRVSNQTASDPVCFDLCPNLPRTVISKNLK